LSRHALIFEAFRFVLSLLLFLFAGLSATELPIPGALCFSSFFAQMKLVFEAGCLARTSPWPKTREMVIGARGEDVAEWMPIERPDAGFVSMRDAVSRVDGLGGRARWVVGVVGWDVGAWDADRGVRFIEEVGI
jgi:hypothetical protein